VCAPLRVSAAARPIRGKSVEVGDLTARRTAEPRATPVRGMKIAQLLKA
jgi:hypothetical protein